ncbi:MAG: hypothetical protein KME35_08675 [Aphanocapsa sp. GSE-SYN-MK-11-07L]|jgi:hypothetical protein|nr:hypothetical protein [Aphanocapsa sp. GSE-SYN-MK-11-07L]
MNRLKNLIVVALAAATAVGCTIGDDSQTATQVPQPLPLSPSPTPVIATAVPPAPIGLIPSTDPDVRRKELKSGRVDPFSSVTYPKPKASTEEGSTSGTSGSLSTPSAPGGKIGTSSGKPVKRMPPQPTQALAVKVLGIAQMGGVPRAIIQAPDERVTRTVAAGDRISNGLVLVRAIEANRSEPVVILEQFGQSVEAPIGGTAVALSPVSGDLPPLPPSQ